MKSKLYVYCLHFQELNPSQEFGCIFRKSLRYVMDTKWSLLYMVLVEMLNAKLGSISSYEKQINPAKAGR